jgi:hypothetical protein
VDSFKLSESAARHSAETYRRSISETTSRDLSGTRPPRVAGNDATNWQLGYNNSGNTIPGYSCAAVGTVTNGPDGYRASLSQPAGTSGVKYGLTWRGNSPSTGPSGSPSCLGYHLEAGWATYDGSGTPVPGQMWGPLAGQWALSLGQPGFIVVAIIDAARNLMLVVPGQTSGGIPVYNGTAYDVPAFGWMKPLSMSAGVITIGQPDNTLFPNYLINGPSPIAPSSPGTALDFGDMKIPTLGAPARGGWGPTSGSWTPTYGNPVCFTVLDDDRTNCQGVWAEISSLTAQVGSAAIAAFNTATNTPGSATVTIWGNNSSTTNVLSATTFTVTALNLSTSSVAKNSFIQVVPINGRWFIVNGGGGGTLQASAQTTAPFSGSTASVTVTGLTPFDGSTDATTSVSNTYNLASNTYPATLLLSRDMSSGSAVWKIAQVQQQLITPMLTWTPADPNIGMTYQPTRGMLDAAATASTYNGTDCP